MAINIQHKCLTTTGDTGRAIRIEDSDKTTGKFPPQTKLWEVVFQNDELYGNGIVCSDYFLKEENADAFIREHGGDPDAM